MEERERNRGREGGVRVHDFVEVPLRRNFLVVGCGVKVSGICSQPQNMQAPLCVEVITGKSGLTGIVGGQGQVEACGKARFAEAVDCPTAPIKSSLEVSESITMS